eukprot:1177185-Prorocentrum_minimum.AAC.2
MQIPLPKSARICNSAFSTSEYLEKHELTVQQIVYSGTSLTQPPEHRSSDTDVCPHRGSQTHPPAILVLALSPRKAHAKASYPQTQATLKTLTLVALMNSSDFIFL